MNKKTLVIMVSMFCFVLGCKTNNQKAEEYYKQGAAKHELKNYTGAIQDFNKAIELNPKHKLAYSDRGIAKFGLGDYQEAIKDYNKAIDLDPKYASPYYNRGLVKDYLKDCKGAIRDYNISIDLDSEFAKAYSHRGECKGVLGDYAGALEDYATACSKGDLPTCNRLAKVANISQGEMASGTREQVKRKAQNVLDLYVVACAEGKGDISKGCGGAANMYHLFNNSERFIHYLKFVCNNCNREENPAEKNACNVVCRNNGLQ